MNWSDKDIEKLFTSFMYVDFRRRFFRTRSHLVRGIRAKIRRRLSVPISGVCVISFTDVINILWTDDQSNTLCWRSSRNGNQWLL